MITRTIEQVQIAAGTIVAQSAGVNQEWLPELERLAARFGASPRPCLFTLPLGKYQQTVVSVQDRSFRFLLLDRACYDVIPDPFSIEARFPPTWNQRGSLPTLEWPDEPLPKRTTKQLSEILKQGDGPFLLGGCQALLDSSRLLLVQPEPATELVRSLWQLIPDSIRRQTTLTTYATNNDLAFNILVLPAAPEPWPAGYLNEEQARDYPESRYERDLQVAVEMDDQRTLDALLARKSSAEVLRMAFVLVLAMGALSLVARIVLAP